MIYLYTYIRGMRDICSVILKIVSKLCVSLSWKVPTVYESYSLNEEIYTGARWDIYSVFKES